MKLTTIFLISILSVYMFAEDFMQPTQIAVDDQHQVTKVGEI